MKINNLRFAYFYNQAEIIQNKPSFHAVAYQFSSG